MAVIPGADGKISVFNSSGTTAINIDVQGYFSAPAEPGGATGGFVPLSPARLADTLDGTGVVQGEIGANQAVTLQVTGSLVPEGSSAVFASVGVRAAEQDGSLRIVGASTSGRGRWVVVGIVVVLVLALGRCALAHRSSAEVRALVEDKAAVAWVGIESHPTGPEGFEGPDVHSVHVVMDEDATGDEVWAVFGALDDAVSDGDVEAITVTLRGKEAALATGETIHGERWMVEDLLKAQQDDRVVEYLFEDFPVLPSVEITLVPLPFDEVVAYADRYREHKTLESVEIVSGWFLLIRDSGNESQDITNARQDLVEQVLQRFELLGAGVAGRGPLDLYVKPADVKAVERYVARVATPDVRRVVVRTTRPDWARSATPLPSGSATATG